MPLQDALRPHTRRPSRRWLAAVLFIAGIVHSAIGQQITEYELPTPGGRPQSITAGPDGNMWFTAFAYDNAGNFAAASIGRITLTGEITEFPIPASSRGGDIVAGPDGNLWFTEGNANQIGRITTAGVLTEFPIPTAGSLPQGITAGPDGALWFAEQSGNKIARMSTDGVVTAEFAIPTPVSNPWGITTGPDGNLWFTEQSGSKVGRITPAGVITEFTIPTPESIPHEIVAGPDGNLWFVQTQGAAVGRITRAGVITEFPTTFLGRGGLGMASGPDGNLWFTENGGQVGRITTDGTMTEFPSPVFGTVAVGPDGALWLTEEGASRIARMTTGPCVANATTLCLGGRFSVRASWQAARDATNGQASAVPASGKSGYFWFSDAGNIEVVVKLLDGCSVNDHVWFYAAGMTNAEVALAVVDTQTGDFRNYTSVGGSPFPPIQDLEALSVCP